MANIMEWLPIEQAPNDTKLILGWKKRGQAFYWTTGINDASFGGWRQWEHAAGFSSKPTHYLLPEEP